MNWSQLKDWDSHQSRFHGQLGRRFRERSVIANTHHNEGKKNKQLSRGEICVANLKAPCKWCESG